MTKVGIVGISGYSGGLALELLLKHPFARVTYVSANTTKGRIEEIWPHLKGKTKLYCDPFDLKKAIGLCDVLFLAVPHTVAMGIVPKLLKAGKRVIDISADYRLNDTKLYKTFYGQEHKDKKNLSLAVYGLPELYREKIKRADLVANPGCYPTAAILALAPLVALKAQGIESLTIDAKSGVSGAGRKAALSLLFSEVNESMKAYKVLTHQHTPEIEYYLSRLGKKALCVDFVPHLIPINRGILETIYVRYKKGKLPNKIHDLYMKFYKTEKFVRILKQGEQPEVKCVTGTNYCDISLAVEPKHRLIVITSVIDNLMKGASGQAVQNFNIMCGYRESAGLI
ncbi:MAG: N-acetyl-gamma-glutamyl-phosphate reductase [Candidatus Omnitrophota bacterium]